VGEVFAGHRIESQIGRGGMGVVYRARHLVLNRDVALKVIAPHLAEDAGFIGRFKRESIVAAGIDHPNVIPIYHAGESEGTYFITMRLVPGTDLRAYLTERGALPDDLAVRILAPVGSALDAAHHHKLVHRDVKPGNILLGEPIDEPRVYLTDFGLTKRTISGGGLTRTGQVVGTFDYVAPEQIESGAVDSRTDIYSLGCVFYEMLTGDVPYPMAEDAAKLWAHMSSEPPSVATSRPDLPAELDAVVRRAMAKRREDRFESAGAFVEAAAAAVGGSAPSVAGPPSAPVGPTNGAPAAETPSAPGPARQAPPPPPPQRPSPAPPPQQPPPVAQPSPVVPVPQPSPAPSVVAKSRRRLPLLIGGSLLVVVIVVALLVLGLVLGGGGGSGASTVDVGQTPSDVAVGEGGVWVVNNGEGTLSRVDADSRKVVGGKIPVGDNPQHVAVGDGAVWVTRSGSAGDELVRVDAASARAGRSTKLDSNAYGVAAGHGAAWVVDGRRSLLRIDASTGRIKRIHAGNSPADVAVDGQFVWVVNSGDGTVVGIDPSTQRRTEGPIKLEARANAIAAGGGNVWVLNPEASNVTRIDAGPGHTVDPPLRVSQRPSDVAVGDGYAWVVAPDAQELLRFKAGSGAPAKKTVSEGPGSVAFGERAVWVTEDTANRLLRVDPGSIH